MTAAALTPSIEYIENGATLVFALPFRFRSPQNISAKRISTTGVVTGLVYGTDYSATGGSTDAGGSLTVMAAAVAGTRLVIKRVTPRAQTMDYTTSDTFPAESHEDALDTAMLIDQEQDVKINDTAARAVLVPEGDLAPPLPFGASAANKLLGFGATGEELVVVNPLGGADDALRDDLADPLAGAALAAFAQPEGGAATRSAMAKLRSTLIERADYTSDAAYLAAIAARPTVPHVDGIGNFDARVTPKGEYDQIDLSNAALNVQSGPREALIWAGPYQMNVFRAAVTMSGFRVRGQFTKSRAPTFAMPVSKTASFATDLDGMTAPAMDNWYGLFACANNGDATASLRYMPFLRCGVVSGLNVPLVAAGESQISPATKVYPWTSTNNLAGTDCLVIAENGGWIGRVATITANSASQISLSATGGLASSDFLLPAPPSFDHYCYLGPCYLETSATYPAFGETRNMYDDGRWVRTKGVFLLSPDASTGEHGPGAASLFMDMRGYVSPLATAGIIESQCVLATASIGPYAEYFDGDGGAHIFDTRLYIKNSSGSEAIIFNNVHIPFAYHQMFDWSNAGVIAATRVSGQLNVVGYVEP